MKGFIILAIFLAISAHTFASQANDAISPETNPQTEASSNQAGDQTPEASNNDNSGGNTNSPKARQTSLFDSSIPSSRKTKLKTGKAKAQRAASNVYVMFDKEQIREFKKAFNKIDHNRDGFIDKESLQDLLATLGKDPSDAFLEDTIRTAPELINFSTFIQLFGEPLTEPGSVNGEGDTGRASEESLREDLPAISDVFKGDEVDELLRPAPIENENSKYVEYTRLIKHSVQERR